MSIQNVQLTLANQLQHLRIQQNDGKNRLHGREKPDDSEAWEEPVNVPGQQQQQ